MLVGYFIQGPNTISYGAVCTETNEMVACRLGKPMNKENATPFSQMESGGDPTVGFM